MLSCPCFNYNITARTSARSALPVAGHAGLYPWPENPSPSSGPSMMIKSSRNRVLLSKSFWMSGLVIDIRHGSYRYGSSHGDGMYGSFHGIGNESGFGSSLGHGGTSCGIGVGMVGSLGNTGIGKGSRRTYGSDFLAL